MSPWLDLEGWEARSRQIAWVADHLDDLQADFLHIWGIDLDVEAPPGWRFFAMARRTFAYSGVMAARLAEEDRRTAPAPPAARAPARPASGPAPSAHRAGPAGAEVREVSLEQMAAMFPGLIEM
ncbi:hypothetical protein [Saccharothrix xinjiangensis]|uniref:Uncharacterized protein n=1 Tax=Saccharothrix xinjiangensis TaxID=204798 RepID=A0ABV9XW11_9PSEU